MSGSCTSSNPPRLIFTSWPVATAACLLQLRRQTRWWEGVGKHTGTSENARRGNSHGPARSLLHWYWTPRILVRLGNGLQTFFWPLSVLKPTKKHKIAQRREAFCVDESQLKPLLLWAFTYSSYFAVRWPQLLGSWFNSWLIWFITCLRGLKVQRVWWICWIWLPLWCSANMFFFPKTEKLCVIIF